MRVYRSPTRLFLFGLLGLLLIVASIDIMFTHWVSTPPENTDGVLTTRGEAQQRGDLLWGAILVGTGSLLVVGAVVELLKRDPQCVVGSEGIELPMGKNEDDVIIPWGDIRSVRSDVTVDGFDGSSREQLIIDVIDTTGLPDQPHGAEWFGRSLHVDTTGWTKAVSEVALAAQGSLGHYRRVEEIKQMEAPSLTWETTVGTPPDDGDTVDSETQAETEAEVPHDPIATATESEEVDES